MRHPEPSIPGLEDDPEGARIVAEELKLLSTVSGLLADADALRAATAPPALSR